MCFLTFNLFSLYFQLL